MNVRDAGPFLFYSKTGFGIVKSHREDGNSSWHFALSQSFHSKFQNCLYLAIRLRETDFDGYNAWNINVLNIWIIETLYTKQNFDMWSILRNIKKVNTTKTQVMTPSRVLNFQVWSLQIPLAHHFIFWFKVITSSVISVSIPVKLFITGV